MHGETTKLQDLQSILVNYK